MGQLAVCQTLPDIPWWRHQMETFSALLALCAGNSPVPVNSPHKGQWRGALMFSLICASINDWVNNHAAGDLRRHRGHFDVNVMHMPVIHFGRLCVKGLGMGPTLISLSTTYSLSPVVCGCNFKSIIFKLPIQNSSLGARCAIPLMWIPQDLTNE